MNDFLEFISHLVYILCSILVFPLLAIVRLLLWSVVAIRQFRAFTFRLKTRTFHFPKPAFFKWKFEWPHFHLPFAHFFLNHGPAKSTKENHS